MERNLHVHLCDKKYLEVIYNLTAPSTLNGTAQDRTCFFLDLYREKTLNLSNNLRNIRRAKSNHEAILTLGDSGNNQR